MVLSSLQVDYKRLDMGKIIKLILWSCLLNSRCVGRSIASWSIKAKLSSLFCVLHNKILFNFYDSKISIHWILYAYNKNYLEVKGSDLLFIINCGVVIENKIFLFQQQQNI